MTQTISLISAAAAIVTGAARHRSALSQGLASVGVSVALADVMEDGLRDAEQAIAGRGLRASR